MPEIRYARQFIEDAKEVQLASKRQEIRRSVEHLSVAPEIGSSRIPKSLEERYGSNNRKLVVSPFIVVYEIDEDADVINVFGLVHQRAAR